MGKKFLLSVVIWLTVFTAISTIASSQRFINKKYDKVLATIKKYKVPNDSTTITFSNTENSIKMDIGGKGSQPATFEYFFASDKKCITEKVTAYCDSCYKKFLTELLSKKKFGWKRLNENQYVSAFKWQLMIELPVKEERKLFYNLMKVTWSKETYGMLLEGAKK